MTVKEYLKNEKVETPQWLMDFKPGDKLYMEDIFNSRIVYYPGSGYDGQPIRTFNNAHFAHVFINADYYIRKEDMAREFAREDCLRGYSLLDMQEITEDMLTPHGWRATCVVNPALARTFVADDFEPYCLAAVFQRNLWVGEEHGASRILVIAIGADGIATYDALFANRGIAPDVLVVQDHGFGGNWASFGRNSILERIAIKSRTLPRYLCVEDHNPWNGYKKLEGVAPEIGGMHSNSRYLFRLEDERESRLNFRHRIRRQYMYY